MPALDGYPGVGQATMRSDVIMHALWSDGTFNVGDPAASPVDAGRYTHDKARKLLERIDEQTNDS